MRPKHSRKGLPALLNVAAKRMVGLKETYAPDACWPWSESAVRRNSYGTLKAERVASGAHRLSYILASGPIPDGMIVRHTCDFKPCVNPAHLLVGTYSDNVQDALSRNRMPVGDDHYSRQQPERLARGNTNGARTKPERLSRGDSHYARTQPERLVRGSQHWNAKFNELGILDIRTRYAAGETTLQALADEYGTSRSNIFCIVRRISWKHVA